ncbi:MAG: hypothetical protein DWQ04_17770 [Chloroflexi bacterium]|nr:MAG: hypothetical protein DWQ04_17770 [Chloroflexota bacterium]
MRPEITEFLQAFGFSFLIVMGSALLLALLLLGFVIRVVRNIDVPPDAGFAETLLHTPFIVVLFIDLLDLALDVLAVPFTWVLLDRWGLKALRNVSTAEALIPFTQASPTVTVAWI